MSRAALDQAVASLPLLEASELSALSKKVGALLQLSGRPQSAAKAARLEAADSFQAALYTALASALQRETGEHPAPFAAFLKGKMGEGFQTTALIAKASHEMWFPTATNTETVALCNIYAKLIVAQITESNHPLHWGRLCRDVGRLASIVNAAFPGYARSSIFSLILKQLSNG